MNGYICSPRMYEYKNVVFEVPNFGTPWPLKKDGSPKKLAGKKFWDLYEEFFKLPEEEKKRCCIGGGCQKF